MNRTCLIGCLIAKPELKYTGSNKAFTRFTIAVKRIGQKDVSDFINCVAWNKSAENLVHYMNKGNRISVEGRIQTGSYTAQDGKKRYTFDVVADNIQFLESKPKEDNKTPYDYQEKPKEEDVFADFGEQVEINDNFLD